MKTATGSFISSCTLFCFLFIYTAAAFAQNETKNWYFGVLSGISFTGGAPVVLNNGALNTSEGCSAMSDGNGNLLFYTDGVNVYNKNHVTMPNGTGLNGDPSSTQSALIVKKPGSNPHYYIFTVAAEGTGDFCYSIVDMNLDNGKGDVVSKNTIVKQGNVTEKLSAVYHCNGTDVWVMIHDLGSSAFRAYPLTAAGVGTAVVSSVGPVHYRVHGQMKFNTAGTKIACVRDSLILQGPPYQGLGRLDIFNFNNQTGVVSTPLSLYLSPWQKAYGMEFSPDGSRIYASCYDVSGPNGGNSEIYQYNLTATNVAASGVTVGASMDPDILRAMQLAPDGKIYISKSGTPFLCVINSPNGLGPACSYSADVINVDPQFNGNTAMLGLPGFVQSYFHPSFPNLPPCSPTALQDEKEDAILRAWFSRQQENIVLRFTSVPQGNVDITLSDVTGKQVLQRSYHASQIESQELIIPAAELRSGLYLISVKSTEGKFHSRVYKD